MQNKKGVEKITERESSEYFIPERLLRSAEEYSINKIRKVGNKKKQLLMEVPVVLPDERTRRLKILIDTGAEANIIKIGLLPDYLLERARKPLNFMMANGQPMRGGQNTVEIKLCLQQFVDGRPKKEFFWTTAEFYEGDIR